MSYTIAERYVLAAIHEYGGGVDWGGAGSSASHRNAAKALIERGLVQGSYRNSSLTARGVAAAKTIVKQLRDARAAAFAAEKKDFEA